MENFDDFLNQNPAQKNNNLKLIKWAVILLFIIAFNQFMLFISNVSIIWIKIIIPFLEAGSKTVFFIHNLIINLLWL